MVNGTDEGDCTLIASATSLSATATAGDIQIAIGMPGNTEASPVPGQFGISVAVDLQASINDATCDTIYFTTITTA